MYKVARGDSAQALEYNVDCLRAKGYKYVGGVCAYVTLTRYAKFLQAMEKEESSEVRDGGQDQRCETH